MIPKVFHHVWPGADPFRTELHRFRSSFLRHHPDWTFHFWRTALPEGADDDVRALLADSRHTVVVKSDVLRFEVLRLYGGIYVDTDMECLESFEPLLGAAFFCGSESEGMLCPSVMGCVPGHPLCALFVRRALERIREAGPERANANPNQVSGPFLLTELVRERSDVRVHDPGHFYPVPWWATERLKEPSPGAYAKHWWRGATSPDGWTKALNFG
jgi:mannosyltransferase OCH1-like enzyme